MDLWTLFRKLWLQSFLICMKLPTSPKCQSILQSTLNIWPHRIMIIADFTYKYHKYNINIIREFAAVAFVGNAVLLSENSNLWPLKKLLPWRHFLRLCQLKTSCCFYLLVATLIKFSAMRLLLPALLCSFWGNELSFTLKNGLQYSYCIYFINDE